MRIAICVHNLANGGAERVAALWATGFVRHGDDVAIILAEKDAPIEYCVPSQVHIENIYTDGNSVARYVKKVAKLRSFITYFKPDVAIAIMKPWPEWLLLTTIGLKTRVINTEHNSFERPESAPMSKEMRFRKFWLNRLFPAVTVLTEADNRILSRYVKKVFTMPNPLAFNPHYDKNEKRNVVLAAGRLDMWYVKGFDLLIKAWGKVAPNNPNWKLQIAGRGNDQDVKRLKRWIAEQGVQDSVELLGFCPKLEEKFRTASIFVLSSRYEGFGLVLIEAMSQGCAPIASDYNGRASEIITKPDEGLLCATDDSNGLAENIEDLINDVEHRHHVQECACQRSIYYSIDNTIQRWQTIFDGLKIKRN